MDIHGAPANHGPKPVETVPAVATPSASVHVHHDVPLALKNKDRKSLAIALVVAAFFLLIALGLAVWLFFQKQQGNDALVPPTEKKITSFSWVAPATLPAAYLRQEQSTVSAATTIYSDVDGGCYIVTRSLPMSDDIDKALTQASDSEGITTTTLAKGSPLTITDVDGEHEYEFTGVEFDQTVSVPSIAFTKQSNAGYYREVGERVAAITYTCKLDAWDAKVEELSSLVKQFTLKTER